MKKLFHVFIISVVMSITAIAQDVAFCGWDGVGGDEFTFVLLRDFSAGEVIYFTEDEYSDASGNFLTSEGHLAYTVPTGGLLENDVIRITETGANVFTVGCATGAAVHLASSGTWSFSNADELYAYSASNPAAPWSSVTAVHCFAWFSNTSPLADQDPSNDYPNYIYIAFNIGGGSGVNANFMDGNRTNTTKAMLQDGANWTQNSGAITLSCTDFSNHMLPVELVAFKAEEKNETVYLNWTTASEINNDYFEIEHSKNGVNFVRIGMINGKGTTTFTTHYSFIDERPANGYNYYRLKQVDFDSHFEYSDIVSAEIRNDNNEVAVYPNPFDESVTVQFPSLEKTYSDVNIQTIEVYDIWGKLVDTYQTASNEFKITLDFSKLVPGTYFIHATVGQNTITTQRIMKF